MDTDFIIPRPNHFHEELDSKRSKLLEDALGIIKDIIEKKRYSVQQNNKDAPIQLLLFTNNSLNPTLDDIEESKNFGKTLADPFFPQDEFDQNLKNFGWKFLKDNNWYFLVEIK